MAKDKEMRHGQLNFAQGTDPRRQGARAVGGMGAHITYLSDAALCSANRKFGKPVSRTANPTLSFDAGLPGGVATCATRESDSSSVSTPNAYLYITSAMDYFDLAGIATGSCQAKTRFKDTPDAVLLRLVHIGWDVAHLGFARHRAQVRRRKAGASDL